MMLGLVLGFWCWDCDRDWLRVRLRLRQPENASPCPLPCLSLAGETDIGFATEIEIGLLRSRLKLRLGRTGFIDVFHSSAAKFLSWELSNRRRTVAAACCSTTVVVGALENCAILLVELAAHY